MRGLAILVLIVLFFWLLWPMVSRWLKRKAMERTEDYIRRSMGMPPREKKGGRNRDNRESYREQTYQRHYRTHKSDEPIIPKEYAEDVEFVEVKEFSSERITQQKEGNTKTYKESQISDVEWTEIKKSRAK